MKEKWFVKLLLQESKPRSHTRPAPAQVFYLQHLDLEHVAGFSALDENGSGQCVDSASIHSQKIFDACPRSNLRSAGIEAAHVHGIAGCNRQSWFKSAVPA